MLVTVAAPGSLRMDKLFNSGLHLYDNLTMNLRLVKEGGKRSCNFIPW